MANSNTTRARIARAFGREASVVYPPVQTSRFGTGRVAGHFLVVSELMAHKHIETAVRAFTRTGLPLVVVGDGPESVRLRRLAGPCVRFTGRVSDAEVAELMRSCQALVVTAEEEFGIAAVEAQAAGRPVIALGRGGVRETVLEGRTGCFYPEDRPEALVEVLRTFDAGAYDPAACVANADRFSVARFREALHANVNAALAAQDAPAAPRPVSEASAA